MKILLAVRSLNVGGTERQVVEIAKALTAENCIVHVVRLVAGGEFESELKAEEHIKLHSLGGSKLLRFFRLRRLVKHEQYDAVFGFLPNMNLLLLGARALRHRPVIAWGVRSSKLNLDEYPRSVRLVYRVEKVMSGLADSIITNSKAAEIEYKARGYHTGNIVSVPNVIDTERFSNERSTKQVVAEQIGIPADSKIIGIFGRIHPTKDHSTFLAAAEQLLQEKPNIHFLIVGGMSPEPNSYGAQLKRISKSTQHSSNIHWLGERLDPETLMEACDLTTLTSTAEGFPNAIAESMACGTPVVSTDVGDAAEIISDTGKIVDIGDSKSLAAAWKNMLELPTEELHSLGIRARSLIIERYSSVKVAQRLKETLSIRQR